MTISRKIMGSNKFAPSYAGSLSKIDTITIGGSYRGIVVSADGKSVYVADYSSTSVFIFDRDITTGILTANGTISTGLGEITGICISADGTSVYVVKISGTGPASSGLVLRFNRNTSTGALTSEETISTGDYPTGICISDDGLNVYVHNFYSQTISMFSRSLFGVLTSIGTTSSGNAVGRIFISPDGTSVYVLYPASGSANIWSRNTVTGILTYYGSIVLTSASVPSTRYLCISSDNQNVYVTEAGIYYRLLIFNRNTSTGALTANGSIIVGYEPTSVCISADGTSVYSTGFDNKVSIFSRNTSTGDLSGTGAIVSVTSASNCYLAISADGTSVYLAADNSFIGKIVTFSRT